MGYFTNNIAKESITPELVSLSSNPNFIQFENANDITDNKHINITWQIINTGVSSTKTKISIYESMSHVRHEFIGTRMSSEVNNTTFYISQNRAVTAENIRACLMNNVFFRGNFLVTIPPINDNGILKNGETIHIKSLGTGMQYLFNITLDADFILQTGSPDDTFNNDSIDGGSGNVSILIDVYQNTGLFLGADDRPASNQPIGEYLETLSKSYYGVPIWFNLNSIIGSRKVYSNAFLDATNWCDSGTLIDFRFIAKRFNGYYTDSFYISNTLYSITGYTRTLEQNDLKRYIYNTIENNIVKPLTTQPALTHISGQTQFFNFILSDPQRDNNNILEYDLGINYRLYTQSMRFIAEVPQTHSQNRKRFSIVNTLKLDIDRFIRDYDNVGVVEVYLSRMSTPISEPLTFRILPECLYKVNDFAFLNSLGGWSSFNFGGTETTDFKTSSNTINKTQTPNHNISSEIESIYNKEVTEQFTVQTMPIKENVCNWLKELSSSIAVYELSTKRYVIVDELNIKPNSKDDLFRLEMKYHYSDSYNALIK